MNKIMIACIVFGFALSSCNSNDSLVQFRALNETMNNSNLHINQYNRLIYDAMQDELRDPQTQEKAMIWQPKAIELQELSTDIIGYIDSLKLALKRGAGLTITNGIEIYNEADKNAVSLLFEKQNKAVELFYKLIDFKKTIIAIIKPEEFSDNPILQKNLISYVNKLQTSVLVDVEKNIKSSTEILISTYFKNTSALGAYTILNKIQNDISGAENNMLNYFHSFITRRHGGFESFSRIVTQNSSYLKPGQPHEIYAGIGSFSLAAKPKITINGVIVPADADGVSIYKSKAENKPGKHSITVTIKFIKPDGTPATVNKNIEYIVAE